MSQSSSFDVRVFLPSIQRLVAWNCVGKTEALTPMRYRGVVCAGTKLMTGHTVRAGFRCGDSDRQDAVSGARVVNWRGAGSLKSRWNRPDFQPLTGKTAHE